ncbi:hypothetical protein ElyMa_006439200 [Elysia marginata]|uniref:Uncharacterized protein n=1 Tax=Elysia marginata TaxID=1093978 RepID=A0AAV4HVF0_9GAST|nr:hypothetical protein ElyMa_006439200 [Elysia marginata]
MRTFLICLLVVALLGFALADEEREKRVFKFVGSGVKKVWGKLKNATKALKNGKFKGPQRIVGDMAKYALAYAASIQINKAIRKALDNRRG